MVRWLTVAVVLAALLAVPAAAGACASVRIRVTSSHPAQAVTRGCPGTYTAHVRVNGESMPLAELLGHGRGAVFYGVRTLVKVVQRGAVVRVTAQTVAHSSFVRVWFGP